MRLAARWRTPLGGENLAMVALLKRHGARLDADGGPETQALEFQLRASGGVAVSPGVIDGLFRDAVLASNVESIAYLHKQEARVSAAGAHADTPLHVAVRAGAYGGGRGIPNDNVVRWLLEAGADVNARNDAGETPLSLAVDQSTRGPTSHALVRLLLARGAHTVVGDRTGATPLHRAVGSGQTAVATILLEAGAKVEARDSKGRTPLHEASSGPVAELLLRRGADPNARDNDGSTPLHAAASTSVDVVTLLVEHGSDVNARNKARSAPLLAAASWEKRDVLTYLLDHGADVRVQDGNGWTALYYAARRGNVECIRLLLDRGADVAAAANDRSTPASVARQYDQAAAVSILEQWHRDKGPCPRT